eukprot:1136157-Pelagomonas_calceolata.AAC.11
MMALRHLRLKHLEIGSLKPPPSVEERQQQETEVEQSFLEMRHFSKCVRDVLSSLPAKPRFSPKEAILACTLLLKYNFNVHLVSSEVDVVLATRTGEQHSGTAKCMGGHAVVVCVCDTDLAWRC